MIGRLRQALHVLLHVEGAPHRTALAFGIGVWIAFFPILGIHTGMALAIAFFFRLSRTALLVGAYLNNPWTLAPLYMAGTLLGCVLLGVPAEGLPGIDWRLHGLAFYRTLFQGLKPYVLPFVVGNTVMGIVGGVAGYCVLRYVLERRRR